MLEFETQGSPCLLDLDEFKDPFAYRLKAQERDETVERRVDLVETFTYLLGITVTKMREFVAQDGILRYRAVLGDKDGKRVAIVWRPVNDLEDDEAALFADQAFIEHTILHALLGDPSPTLPRERGGSTPTPALPRERGGSKARPVAGERPVFRREGGGDCAGVQTEDVQWTDLRNCEKRFCLCCCPGASSGWPCSARW